MKQLMVIPLLLLSSFLHAIDFYSYNQLIKKGDQIILEGNYGEANKFYDSAMRLNPEAQAADVQKALIAAVKSNNKSVAFLHARHLASLGVGAKYFDNIQFSLIKLDKEVGPTILRDAEINMKKFARQNKEIIKTLWTMNEEAQKDMYTYMQSSRSASDQQAFINNKDKLGDQLLRIFNEKGYLSEYKIGANMVDDQIADPIFSNVIQITNRHPAPPDDFEIVPDQEYEKVLRKYFTEGLISEDYVKRLGYSSIATINF